MWTKSIASSKTYRMHMAHRPNGLRFFRSNPALLLVRLASCDFSPAAAVIQSLLPHYFWQLAIASLPCTFIRESLQITSTFGLSSRAMSLSVGKTKLAAFAHRRRPIEPILLLWIVLVVPFGWVYVSTRRTHRRYVPHHIDVLRCYRSRGGQSRITHCDSQMREPYPKAAELADQIVADFLGQRPPIVGILCLSKDSLPRCLELNSLPSSPGSSLAPAGPPTPEPSRASSGDFVDVFLVVSREDKGSAIDFSRTDFEAFRLEIANEFATSFGRMKLLRISQTTGSGSTSLSASVGGT